MSQEAATREVEILAKTYRAKLRLLFWPPLIASVFFGWLGAWAQHQSGWEASVIWFALMAISTVLLMLSLFTGVLLYRWRKLHRRALVEAHKLHESPAWFREVFKEVVGPFPW